MLQETLMCFEQISPLGLSCGKIKARNSLIAHFIVQFTALGSTSSADNAREKSKLLMVTTLDICSLLPCRKQDPLAVLTSQEIKLNY